jgi:hypothetical protein
VGEAAFEQAALRADLSPKGEVTTP